MNEIVTQQHRELSPLQKFRSQIEQRASELRAALPRGIDPEKFQRTLVTAVQQNMALLGADRQSLVLACIKAAQDGLLPDGREAALVIFSTRVKGTDGQFKSVQMVQYMPMVYGLRKKILQATDIKGNPVISGLTVGLVYRAEVENGYFVWERGSDIEVQHRPMLDLTEEQAYDSEIVAAYSIATMADGNRSYEVMRRFEIDKVRQKSQTGAVGQTMKFGKDAGKPIEPKGPWVTDFGEMAKKTVMRRHSKVLPMSGDVFLALENNSEATELAAASSAAQLLDSQAGSEPVAIEDGTGDQYDTDTGEITNAEQGEVPKDTKAEPEAKAEPAKRTRGPNKPKADPVPAQAAEPANNRQHPEPEASTDQAESATGKPEVSTTGDTQESAGEERHPADIAADELITAMRGATTVIDLDRYWKEADEKGHLNAMPDDRYTEVLAAHAKEGVRLGRRSRQPA